MFSFSLTFAFPYFVLRILFLFFLNIVSTTYKQNIPNEMLTVIMLCFRDILLTKFS